MWVAECQFPFTIDIRGTARTALGGCETSPYQQMAGDLRIGDSLPPVAELAKPTERSFGKAT